MAILLCASRVPVRSATSVSLSPGIAPGHKRTNSAHRDPMQAARMRQTGTRSAFG
eukprot:CAMPEP_0170284972 /NCGR_PEP_ID=MMETSP0116_2-20130129/42529_1 /TAXON_ID=400756 /ORGANISM="Durinskia baltica, Strain CSIRO CS-38" /LENGTH=54 /DNA_ID=CAMNT_0010536361 /DNA_START=54 /DNA_END=215 /DNA_ORIENTATION=-